MFPLGLTLTDKGLLDWLRSRVIPRNREFVDKILSVYGLDHNNILGIVKLCMGLSVNDSYWIVPEGFEGKFKDYNLFENGFDKALSLIAWTGFGSVRPSAFSSSPEFTTNGNLRKGWRRIGGKIMLYNGGNSGAANTDNEPYSKFYVSQIAEAMGLNHVSYKLAKFQQFSYCERTAVFRENDLVWIICKNIFVNDFRMHIPFGVKMRKSCERWSIPSGQHFEILRIKMSHFAQKQVHWPGKQVAHVKAGQYIAAVNDSFPFTK